LAGRYLSFATTVGDDILLEFSGLGNGSRGNIIWQKLNFISFNLNNA